MTKANLLTNRYLTSPLDNLLLQKGDASTKVESSLVSLSRENVRVNCSAILSVRHQNSIIDNPFITGCGGNKHCLLTIGGWI